LLRKTDIFSVDKRRSARDNTLDREEVTPAVFGSSGHDSDKWRKKMRPQRVLRTMALAVLLLAPCASVWADLSANLVARYTFTGNANDVSGDGHNGTVYGATLTADRFGNPNSAYSFDGVNDYVRVPDAPQLNGMNALTLSLWIEVNRADHEAEVLNKYFHYSDTRFDDSYNMGIDPGGQTAFQYATADGYVIKISSGALDTDSWHHIAGVYTGTKGSVYIDGSLVALSRNDPESPGPLNSITDDLLIGCGNSPGGLLKFFDGSIDDVRIYSRALSSTEIEELTVVPVPGAALLGVLGLSFAGWRLRRKTS
jgi:hypothetical protein